MHQRREAVVALILGSVLLGCNVVPHIQSNPNVALIDTEHHEEDEFVEMQEPVKNVDPAGKRKHRIRRSCGDSIRLHA